MSTSWGYRCNTCGVDSPTWFNHGQPTLCEAVEKWPAIKAIRDADLSCFDVEITAYIYEEYGDKEPTLFEFLDAHHGHELMLLNEYGDTVSIEFTDPTQT